MQAFWNFDEDSGTAVHDVTGNGNDVTWGGPLGNQWTSGIVKYGGEFTGGTANDGNYAKLDPGPADMQMGMSDFSMSVWFKTPSQTSTYGNRVLLNDLSDSAPGGGGSFQLGLYDNNPSQVRTDIYDNAGNHVNIFNSGLIYTTSAWHLAVVTVDRNSSTGIQLSLDGGTPVIASSTGLTGAISPTGPLMFGANGGTWQYYDGALDAAGIWTRALSPSEISELYNGGAGWQYPVSDATPTPAPSSPSAPIPATGATAPLQVGGGIFLLLIGSFAMVKPTESMRRRFVARRRSP